MEEIVFTIDIGTTAIKYVGYQQESGEKVYQKQDFVDTHYGANGLVCQSPTAIWQKIHDELSNQTLPLCLIVLSTPMHTLIPLGTAEEPVMYIWQDTQSATVAKEMTHTAMGRDIYQRTGTPLHPMSPFLKLRYFQVHQSEWFQTVEQWTDLKGYLMEKLTGNWVTDYSNASASGLWNSVTMNWDSGILDLLKLTSNQFPLAVEPTEEFPISACFQPKSPSKECRVMIGSSDGCLASYASYQANGIAMTLTIGTSGALRILSNRRWIDPKERLFCYYLAHDTWVIGGPTNNGGKVLTWLSQLFLPDEKAIFDYLPTLYSQQGQATKSSLLFYPYLFGERAPLWDGTVRANFIGADWHHTKADFLRAGVEGILFNLRYIADGLETAERIVAVSGGFFAIPTMSQLTATILQKEVLHADTNDPNFGAYLLTKQLPMITEPSHDEQHVYLPDEQLETEYEKTYQLFVTGLKKMYQP